MSFRISKKKIKGKQPIAKINGGENDKSYLYMQDFKYNIKDVPEKMVSYLNDDQKKEVDTALSSGYEPECEIATKCFYDCKNYIKKKNCKLVLRGGGKFVYVPSEKVIERVLICGISGSGKSTWASSYVKQWKKAHGGNGANARPFYICSNVDEDEVLDKMDPIRVDPEEIAYDGMSIEEEPEEGELSIYDSLFLADDIESIENTKIRKATRCFLNNMLETSRHYSTYMLITAHIIQNNFVSRVQLNEANVVVMFAKSNARAVTNFLKSYEYFTQDQIDRVLGLNSRWICLVKHMTPMIILTERQVYIV